MEKRLFLDKEYAQDVKYKINYFSAGTIYNSNDTRISNLIVTINNTEDDYPLVKILDRNNDSENITLYKIAREVNTTSQSEQ